MTTPVVTRYTFARAGGEGLTDNYEAARMEENCNGEWVRVTDFEDLQKWTLQLQAAVEILLECIKKELK